MAEGHAPAEPFSYRTAQTVFAGIARTVRVNQASRRRPKPHVTVRYLEPDFTAMFLNGLAGLGPDGAVDRLFHGRELARNACVGGLAVATGLRLQEFTYLLAYEVPGLPRRRTEVPIAFPVPTGVTKGRKFGTTWISYDALAAVRQYLQLDRAATVEGSAWSPPPAWGEPLLVTDADERGGRISGVRRRWGRVARRNLPSGLPQNRLCGIPHNRLYVPRLIMLSGARLTEGSSCSTRCPADARST